MLIDEIVATFDAAPGVYRFRTVPITIYVVDTER